MNEQQIREMMRAEIRAAFSELAESAGRCTGYDSDVIEDKAASVLATAAQNTEETLSHEPSCEVRAGTDIAWYMRDCTC